MLERCTIEELARDPVGRYSAGGSWVHFCAAPTLWGVVLWGRPGDGEALQLGQSLVLELSAPAVPHASLIDCSRLEGADPAVFRLAERYLIEHTEALEKNVLKVALLRPSGLKGATVAGAYEVLPRPYPVSVFADVQAAWRWLSPRRPPGWPKTPGFLAELYAEASSASPVLLELRAWLDAHLSEVELKGAAKALGLSERTLQRKLSEAKVTFTAELSEARLRAAKRLLTETDAKLTSIAVEVGFSSLQHFSALFRKRLAMSPSQFRANARN